MRQRLRLTQSALWLLGAALMSQTYAPQAAFAQETADQRTLDINEYVIDGNTILSELEVEEAVYPFLGPSRPLSDVEAARTALEHAYAQRGYQTVIVEIPQQRVTSDGVLRLRIVETQIGSVHVAGADHISEERLREALPSLREGAAPNISALNNELLAFNIQSNDRRVTPDIQASDEPGRIDVTLNVEDESAWHGGFGINNQYSAGLSEWRGFATLRYEDLWARGHEIGIAYASPFETADDGETYIVSYAAPLADEWRLDVSALHSNSDVSTIAGINVLGQGDAVTVALSKPLGAIGGDWQHSISASIAYKSFDEVIRLGASEDQAPITYYPLSLSWAGASRSEENDLSMNAGITFAARDTGSSSDEFGVKRYNASGAFFYFSGGFSWRHSLPYGIDLNSSLNGQWANEPLISNEQYAIGGAGTVRGYLQSEAIGDNGFVGSLEVRSPSLMTSSFDEFRLFGFYDAGKVWLIDALPDQHPNTDLSSMGLGLRFRAFEHVSGEIEFGYPIAKTDTVRNGESRVHVRLGVDF